MQSERPSWPNQVTCGIEQGMILVKIYTGENVGQTFQVVSPIVPYYPYETRRIVWYYMITRTKLYLGRTFYSDSNLMPYKNGKWNASNYLRMATEEEIEKFLM